MIVFQAEMAESLGDGVEPRCFRLVPERVVRVCPVDDLGQEDDGWVPVELMLLHERIERALLAVVPEHHPPPLLSRLHILLDVIRDLLLTSARSLPFVGLPVLVHRTVG